MAQKREAVNPCQKMLTVTGGLTNLKKPSRLALSGANQKVSTSLIDADKAFRLSFE